MKSLITLSAVNIVYIGAFSLGFGLGIGIGAGLEIINKRKGKEQELQKEKSNIEEQTYSESTFDDSDDIPFDVSNDIVPTPYAFGASNPSSGRYPWGESKEQTHMTLKDILDERGYEYIPNTYDEVEQKVIAETERELAESESPKDEDEDEEIYEHEEDGFYNPEDDQYDETDDNYILEGSLEDHDLYEIDVDQFIYSDYISVELDYFSRSGHLIDEEGHTIDMAFFGADVFDHLAELYLSRQEDVLNDSYIPTVYVRDDTNEVDYKIQFYDEFYSSGE